MTSEQKTVFRIFTVWQEEKEQEWLAAMARQGWHLVRGGLLFKFRRGEPREDIYRFDYRPKVENWAEYAALFGGAGWEYVSSFMGWHYFRTGAGSGAPEIYTDTESRIGKYRRLTGVLALALLVNLLALTATYSQLVHGDVAVIYAGVRVLNLLVTLLLGYAMYRVARIIGGVKRRHTPAPESPSG